MTRCQKTPGLGRGGGGAIRGVYVSLGCFGVKSFGIAPCRDITYKDLADIGGVDFVMDVGTVFVLIATVTLLALKSGIHWSVIALFWVIGTLINMVFSLLAKDK